MGLNYKKNSLGSLCKFIFVHISYSCTSWLFLDKIVLVNTIFFLMLSGYVILYQRANNNKFIFLLLWCCLWFKIVFSTIQGKYYNSTTSQNLAAINVFFWRGWKHLCSLEHLSFIYWKLWWSYMLKLQNVCLSICHIRSIKLLDWIYECCHSCFNLNCNVAYRKRRV